MDDIMILIIKEKKRKTREGETVKREREGMREWEIVCVRDKKNVCVKWWKRDESILNDYNIEFFRKKLSLSNLT